MPWSQLLRKNITDIENLRSKLEISEKEVSQLQELCKHFPMSVTPYYLKLINWEDPHDPIRKMCIPAVSETDRGGTFDTSGEAGNTVYEGIQHKYHETALILTTNRCATYCRHCFRKRLVGQSDDEIAHHFGNVVDYIRDHKEISNVILSGGDALMLPTRTISRYIEAFVDMEHLDLIRIATRMPVVLPMRILEDVELLSAFDSLCRRKQLYLVTQFNHPRELTKTAKEALRALLKCGLIIKNQTVLLKGVNDDPKVLGELLKGLTASGVIPYYIFQCRPVTGVMHSFQVPLSVGYEIVEGAKAMQNGQGKCLKYCMSHPKGKIEIIGKADDDKMIFKYHQAKYDEDAGRIFIRNITENETWLPDDI